MMSDTTPLTLSIEGTGDIAWPLIPKNTSIPTSKSVTFTTVNDGQVCMELHVSQGERLMVTDNRTIGRFILDGILSVPSGVPKIEVTFDIDANGILEVRAQDKATGKRQKITITASGGLSKEEVEKMKRDAEAHAAEDTKKRKEIGFSTLHQAGDKGFKQVI
jgi:molecular chaperone DnaK